MAHEYTSWAWSQGIRGAGRKSVLVALADRANGDGYSYPGQKTLAEMTGQSERSVREHVDWLEEQGYVRRQERRRNDGTRTSDGYYLPPMDSTGNICRWPTTGKCRRMQEQATNPDQDNNNPPPATGESRRQSTGRILQGHRQISPKSPAESAGHELPGELPVEPSAAATKPKTTSAREEAAADPPKKPGPEPAKAETLSTTHPETHKALNTFQELHGPRANPHMRKAWTAAVVEDINQHGELAVLEGLAAAIHNFPSLERPFAFYRACLRQTGAAPPRNSPKEPGPALDQDAITRLINEAKEGTLT